MLCIRLPHLKARAKNEQGSQVVGFALVAPVLVSVALLLVEIISVLICKVSLSTATKEAVHLAALKGSAGSQVIDAATDYWTPIGFAPCGQSAVTRHTRFSGISFVEVRVQRCIEIPLLGRRVQLVSTAREVDEGKL